MVVEGVDDLRVGHRRFGHRQRDPVGDKLPDHGLVVGVDGIDDLRGDELLVQQVVGGDRDHRRVGQGARAGEVGAAFGGGILRDRGRVGQLSQDSVL